MFVRTALPRSGSLVASTRPAAGVAPRRSARRASSWPPGRPASRSLKASSRPDVPVSVPGGKSALGRARSACDRLGAPTSPTTAERRGADDARRGRALGERGAVGGQDRGPLAAPGSRG